MSWIYSESAVKPGELDVTSSKKYNYIRKDIEEFEKEGEVSGEIIPWWRWFEQKIPKADWEVYKVAMQNTSDISDNADAIVELAGLIADMMEG